jgi:hypothetical protein
MMGTVRLTVESTAGTPVDLSSQDWCKGTFFLGPMPAPAPYTPLGNHSANEVRADEIIDRWMDSKGGWKKLRKLIVAALDEAQDD